MQDDALPRKVVEFLAGICDEVDDMFMRAKSTVKLLWRYKYSLPSLIRQAEVLSIVMFAEHPEDLLDVKAISPRMYLAAKAVVEEIDPWTTAIMVHNVSRAHEAMHSTEPNITILPKVDE